MIQYFDSRRPSIQSRFDGEDHRVVLFVLLLLALIFAGAGCTNEMPAAPPSKVESMGSETTSSTAPAASQSPIAGTKSPSAAPRVVPAEVGSGTESRPLSVDQLRDVCNNVLFPEMLESVKRFQPIENQPVIAKVRIEKLYPNNVDAFDNRKGFLRFQIPGVRRVSVSPIGPPVRFSKIEDFRGLVPGQEIVVAGKIVARFENGEIQEARIVSRGPVPHDVPAPIAPLTDVELKESLEALKAKSSAEGIRVWRDNYTENCCAALELDGPSCVDAEGLPSEAVLKQFEKIKNIEQIHIKFAVGTKFLEKLSMFPQITSLVYAPKSLSGNGSDDLNLSALATWPSLTSLRLGGQVLISDHDLEQIARLPALEQLDLFPSDEGESLMTKQGLKLLAKSKSLRILRFTKSGSLQPGALGDEAVSELAKIEHLTSLELRTHEMTGTGISALSACPELEALKLASLQFSDEGLKAIAAQKWAVLHTIDLECPEVTDAGLSSLFACDLKWRRFTCSCKKMTDASLIALSKTTSLEHLSSLGLTDCSITDEGLKILLQKPLPALDDLGLGNTQITDSMVKDLA